MKIGVPKEIKNGECRVALTPDNVQSLKANGHNVLIEKNAGTLAGFFDQDYKKAGAALTSAVTIWKESDLILKVKEPQSSELKKLSPNKILFCYLHLAANLSLTRALIQSKTTAIALETVQDARGRLVLLEPMSCIAGRMAMIVGAFFQATPQGGGGILVSGLPGVLSAKIAIIGGGTVGENAAKIAAGLGAQVTILDQRQDRLKLLDEILPENVSTLNATPQNIEEAVTSSDIIIGAVLIPGSKAPKLITKKMLKKIKPGSVLVDVSIDQGGIAETSRPTTHSKPVYKVNGLLHYCVPNMPGAYGRSATLALTNSIFNYVLKLANLGLKKSFKEDPGFSLGLNVFQGKITCKEVAQSLGLSFTPFS